MLLQAILIEQGLNIGLTEITHMERGRTLQVRVGLTSMFIILIMIVLVWEIGIHWV